jgi:hypothetical protein
MSWGLLEEEIGRWREAGRTVEFWWRDDDAVAPTAPVKQLLELSARTGVPLALAVIPLAAKAELFDGMRARCCCTAPTIATALRPGTRRPSSPSTSPTMRRSGALAVHERGWRSSPAGLRAGTRAALEPLQARARAGARVHGVRGFSAYGARAAAQAAAGVIEVNTHIDIIEWRATRAFCGEEAALAAAIRHLAARRTGAADSAEPTGWLTHHELHDSAAWNFLEQLFERTRRLGACWLDAESIFTASA